MAGELAQPSATFFGHFEDKLMSTENTISAKTKDHPESVTVNYDMPETLEGLVEKFGAEAIANAARDSLVISIQALLRRHIEKPQEELQALADAWVPGQRQAPVAKSAFEKATSNITKLSPEERAELLRRLQAGE